jgi:cold shock CspA family protein
MTGTVIRILLGKGFAFVRDENGDERFASANDFVPIHDFNDVKHADRVEFVPDNNSGKGNGLRATQIRIVR